MRPLALHSALVLAVIPSGVAAQDFDFPTAADSAVSLGRIADPDSVVSIEAPDGWIAHDLGGPDIAIGIGTPEEDAFFIVVVEDKADMYGWNMDRHSYLTLAQTLVAMDFPEVLETEDFQLDGRPSRRIVLQGATQGMQLAYIKVTMDAPSAFVQLVGWSTRSTFDRHRPTIESIVESARSLR
jgi:hypothetical protein